MARYHKRFFTDEQLKTLKYIMQNELDEIGSGSTLTGEVLQRFNILKRDTQSILDALDRGEEWYK